VDLSDHESISPDNNEEETICGLCREQEINGMDSDADDEGEEGIGAKGVKNVYLPS